MAWRKGQSGNPEGRRVEAPWKGALMRSLAQLEIRNADGKVVAKKGKALRLIADTVVTNAAFGKRDEWKEIGERLDGKVPQPLSGDLDLNLTVEITRFADKAP